MNSFFLLLFNFDDCKLCEFFVLMFIFGVLGCDVLNCMNDGIFFDFILVLLIYLILKV